MYIEQIQNVYIKLQKKKKKKMQAFDFKSYNTLSHVIKIK